MREFISIVESFNNPLPYTWIRNDENRHVAEFSTKNHSYTVTFVRRRTFGNAWSVRFALTKSYWFLKHQKMSTTNTGSQFQVLSTVVTCIKDFLNEVSPDMFVFSSLQSKRGKVYDAICNYLKADVAELGYYRTDNDTSAFLFRKAERY